MINRLQHILEKIIQFFPYILICLPPMVFVIRYSSDDLDILTFFFVYGIIFFLWSLFLCIICLLFFYLIFVPFFNIKDIINKK